MWGSSFNLSLLFLSFPFLFFFLSFLGNDVVASFGLGMVGGKRNCMVRPWR